MKDPIKFFIKEMPWWILATSFPLMFCGYVTYLIAALIATGVYHLIEYIEELI